MEYALFLIHVVSYDLDVTPLPRVLKQEMPVRGSFCAKKSLSRECETFCGVIFIFVLSCDLDFWPIEWSELTLHN